MKYNITIIILILVLIVGQILDSYYTLFLGIITVGLIYLIVFLWEFSIFKKDFESDYKFRSQRNSINIYNICIALLWTTLYLTQDNVSQFEIFMITCFWSLPLIEFIMCFIYKANKPFTIFIKDDELIINKRWFNIRSLPNLIQISYNSITKNLSLDFKSKSEITINTKEYKTVDIEKLLEIAIEKSDYNVFVPNNYKPNKN